MRVQNYIVSALLVLACGHAVAQNRDSVLVQPPKHIVEPVNINNHEEGTAALDTLSTINEGLKVIIYSDNTWRYYRERGVDDFDREIYDRYWDTVKLFPYNEINVADLPKSVIIDLVDSLKSYHYPYKQKVVSKYGPRGRRNHQGIDLSPMKIGDPIYATFNGKVRISAYNNGGYGNLVVLRHDNGLETWYGHLNERYVKAGDVVEAGQVIGAGGNTGRSTGPHLHYEIRYLGQTFDPERLINFETGQLLTETFLLKRSYFDIRSSSHLQDWDDEEAYAKELAKQKAATTKTTTSSGGQWHTIRSGDTLGALARRYGTTIDRICKLNNINRNTTLRIGRKLRMK